MSNTRHAEPDSPFRQERYASSPEFTTVLKANLVAMRCTVLESVADRELIWFLQYLSIAKSGMEKAAAEFLQRFEQRIGNDSMRGIVTGACNAKQVAAIRAEIPNAPDKFLLRGEMSRMEMQTCEVYGCEENRGQPSERYAKEIYARAAQRPQQIAIAEFKEFCRDAAAENLSDFLTDLCLNPAAEINASPWYFAELFDCLRDYQSAWSAEHRNSFVLSDVGHAVHNAIDFAKVTRQMVLVTGKMGQGATSAAKAWCDQFPWSVRYVAVPATNDRKAFFSSLAAALGVPNGARSKARELQERCESVLEAGDIALVFDDANNISPNTNLRESMPDRVQWILSALLPAGVPVVLIGLPNFLQKLKSFDEKGGWTMEEFTHRLGDCIELPQLSPEDLTKIARAVLPGIKGPILAKLCLYAFSSGKCLTTIAAARSAAAYVAKSAGRKEPTGDDITNALDLRILPSDKIIASEQPKLKVRSSMKRADLAPAPRESLAMPSTDRDFSRNAPQVKLAESRETGSQLIPEELNETK